MTVTEAERRYAELRAQLDSGRIDPTRFDGEIRRLRLQDANGIWWQVNPETGGWLTWNGSKWVPTARPQERAPTRPRATACEGCGEALRETARFCAKCGTPVRQEPIATHCSGCGEVLREGASFCAACGASVRSAPSTRTRHVIVGSPVRRAHGLLGRPQSWWNKVAILGGGASGVFWFLYSSIRGSKEGLDLLTPLITLLIPIGIVTLRRPLDALLRPLQVIRRWFPRWMLVGAGLVAPYGVAIFLYSGLGMKEYPFLNATLIVGTLVSYLILRTPTVPGRRSHTTGAAR